MNFENWIPIIYEPKTNTHTHKKKKKKKAQMKQLRLNRTKCSQMALLHTPNSKKKDWRIKTINSSTFSATKRILDLKKETICSTSTMTWSPASGTGTSSTWWWTQWLAPWPSPATRIFRWSWSRRVGRAPAPTRARSRLIRLTPRCIWRALWSIWDRGPARRWGRKEWRRCIYTSCLTRKWS